MAANHVRGSQGQWSPQVGTTASNCAHFTFFKIFSPTSPKNLFENAVLFQISLNLFILTDRTVRKKYLKITVAIKYMIKIPGVDITMHKACTSFGSASLPTWGAEGCSMDRSPSCCDCWGALRQLRRREGGSLSKLLRSSQKPRAQNNS